MKKALQELKVAAPLVSELLDTLRPGYWRNTERELLAFRVCAFYESDGDLDALAHTLGAPFRSLADQKDMYRLAQELELALAGDFTPIKNGIDNSLNLAVTLSH